MSQDPFGKSAPLVNPQELPQWILHQDEDVVVINKPGWLVCHPSKNGPWSSLVGAVREYLGCERLHLVSRLDRETSGVVVLARTPKMASLLQTAISRRQVRKRYLVLLQGCFSGSKEVDTRLVSDDRSEVAVRQKVTFSRAGKASLTRFRALCSKERVTLAEVEPVSGRKHQIRVHAEWMGHPVIGDKLYGPDESLYLEFVSEGWTERMAALLPMQRQALHAAEIEFQVGERPLHWSAPVPRDMVECWCGLSGEAWPPDPA